MKLSPTNQKFKSILDDMLALRIKKDADYKGSWRRHGKVGVAIRMSDKMQRLEKMLIDPVMNKFDAGPQVNEKIGDTAIDMAVYAVLLIILLGEEK